MKIKKIINPIKTEYGEVFIKIEFEEKKLSISGVEAPMKNGNCKGGCGQILDVLLNPKQLNEGWNGVLLKELYTIWDRYHLNDMNAGVPKQETFIREWEKTNKYDYIKACEALKGAGLYEIDGYKYGHGWIFEEIPSNVIEFLKSLPLSEKTPAWV